VRDVERRRRGCFDTLAQHEAGRDRVIRPHPNYAALLRPQAFRLLACDGLRQSPRSSPVLASEYRAMMQAVRLLSPHGQRGCQRRAPQSGTWPTSIRRWAR
jgi:hypothetical protein